MLVNSSVIRAIDYDVANSILYVKFKSGVLYKYHRVPETVFNSFLNARSKGTFFNLRIRDKYRVS
uniref:KTSC domain-containing protein n=1 Tax=Flavobacterium columnare TaxID=996 RepID=A0AA94EYJ3_9FLAO